MINLYIADELVYTWSRNNDMRDAVEACIDALDLPVKYKLNVRDWECTLSDGTKMSIYLAC